MNAVRTYVSSLKFVISLSVLLTGLTLTAFSQTAPNTVITNTAKARFQYKSLPKDSVNSNTIQFSVLEAPNFEMSISNPDSFVFGKETVTVRLVYKNIGNTSADTATIDGMLPPAGMRFVPGSTSGVITGNTVSWKVFNVASGKTDSVKVKVVIDSTLVVNTELTVNADILWQASSVSASKIFVVSSFPRLSLSMASSASVIGSGRTAAYTMTVFNTGNIPSLNTVVYDTISSLGNFVNASITPDSLSSDKRLLKWNLGSIPAFSSKQIVLTVASSPNIGLQSMKNSAYAFASNVAAGDNASISTSIVPVRPKSISVVADPVFVWGQLNKDSSKITVTVKDSLGELMPDGTPVTFSATLGTFFNNSSSIALVLKDGSAAASIRAVNVDNDILHSKITAVAGTPAIGTISDTTGVFLYPGAVTGMVVNGINRIPFKGAIARVFNSSNIVVGTDTTNVFGKFFIPLSKDVKKYLLEIVVLDKFGDSIRAVTDIDPTRFPLPPIVIPNIISGRIEYKVSGDPVPAENVSVFLDSISAAPKAAPKRAGSVRRMQTGGSLIRVQEVLTDKNGKFRFDNLRPAKYVISVDSAEFPNFTGYTFLSDTGNGTFTINLSLQIVLDSSVTFMAAAPASANAGDTVHVGIGLTNSGNTVHYNVSVTDTLSPFTTFVNASPGKFSTVTYDSAKRIVRWYRDTLKTLVDDSLTLRYVVAKNIPDNTQIINRPWFNSNILSANSAKITTIRSNGVIQFSNTFAVARDTIIAGDSISHIFRFRNVGTDSIRGLKIVDTLFSAGLSGISLSKSALDSTKIIDSISTIYVGSLAPQKQDSVSLKLITDFALKNGISIISHAYAMKGDSILARRDTMFIVNENPELSSFLKIVKTANKKVAEIGDIVTYQVQITNSSPQFVRSIGVYDMLPYSFKYVKNSARFNGKAIEPQSNPVLNQLLWKLSDTIQSTKTSTLVYQLAVGADAMESEGVNTAYASAVAGFGTTLVSAPSQWQITVRPGVFTEKGLVIGKVFYDDNRNTFQDEGETGVKGIEIWMEDGTKIITGDDGKYSLPEVKPGQHVMRINELTLPEYASLLAGNNAFAKDPSSRFVRVTESGIAKANFYLKRTMKDSIAQTIAKVNKLIAVRQAKPKYLYEDTLRKIKVDTVRMYVSFAYSGNKLIQSIEVTDQLSDHFRLVPNSAKFNGQRINPTPGDRSIIWKLGSAKEVMNGVISYSVVLERMPKARTIIPSSSSIRIVSKDSIVVESSRIITENVIVDTAKNRIETSETRTSTNNPRISNHLSDSVSITAGDVLYLKTSIFIDPTKKLRSLKLLDTLESAFIIDERTFALNGVPMTSKDFSVKVRSSSLSALSGMAMEDLDFIRVASMELAGKLRPGINEITYSAMLQNAKKDTVYHKNAYAVITNSFNEKSILKTNEAHINVRAGIMSHALTLETTYVDIPRASLKVEEKIVEAVKLVESLKMNSTKAVVMEGITFELSKATLTKDSKLVLDNVAAVLMTDKDLKFQINGYTDNTGNAASNRKMSLNRAKEVAAYLVSKGVDVSRLVPQGFGPNNPIATNKTEEGRAKNRRVEFARIK
ncbi:MAG: OmpA family protein [Bacteroidota bacterium]